MAQSRLWSRAVIPFPRSSRLLEFRTDQADRVQLDIDNQRLLIKNRVITLTSKIFEVLLYLSSHEGELVTPKDLIKHIWPDTFIDPSNIKKYILEVRRALGDDTKRPRFVETVSRRGYRFLASVHRAAQAPLTPEHGPVVGRDGNLATLQELFAKAESGFRQLVFITGDAGIGKTTLIRDFLMWTKSHQKTRTGVGGCFEGRVDREAYYPVLELLEDLCEGDLAGSTARILSEHAPAWAARLSAQTFRESRERPGGSGASSSAGGMVREFIRTIEMLAAVEPIALVLEDLQWADAATIDLLNTLARREVPAMLMVVVTFRNPLTNAGATPLRKLKLDLLWRSLCRHIPMECLAKDDIAAYLALLFPSSGPEPRLVQQLYEQSGGNPFIMRATLDELMAQEIWSCDKGEWKKSMHKKPPDISLKVHHFISLLLDSLTPEELAILEAASVAGLSFSPSEVAAALDQDVEVVEANLMCFTESGNLILRAVGPVFSEGAFTNCREFVLASVHEAIYGRIAPRRRQELHRRIGHWLESRFMEHDGRISSRLAMHFQQANEWTKAVSYLLLSADPASRGAVVDQALKLLTKGRR